MFAMRCWLNIPLALASQVLDLIRVLRAQLLELGVQDIADTCLISSARFSANSHVTYALSDKVVGKDLLNYSLAHDDTGWVADPSRPC